MWALGLGRILRFALVLPTGLVLSNPRSDVDLEAFAPEDTIERDVCILGGGSAGTYSAIRLKDEGKSVIVVEKKGRLGGHTETYHDEKTGLTTDAGVVVYHNVTVVTDYFARFNVPLKTSPLTSIQSSFVDFETGRVTNYTMPDPTQAIIKYAGLLAQYPYLNVGIELPDPVPSDLLLPFGEFVTKYGLGDMVKTVWMISQGIGNLLEKPTVYAMKVFGFACLKSLAQGFLTTEDNNNSQLYEKATVELGENALLNANIVSVKRSDEDGVSVIVDTPEGQKLIKAKKLVVTIPPNSEQLEPLDLDEEEQEIFGKFENAEYYTMVVKNANTTAVHHNFGTGRPFDIPKLPATYSIYPTGIPNFLHVKFGSDPKHLDRGEVQRIALENIGGLREAGVAEANDPEVVFFSDHSPFNLVVSSSEIAEGFYKQLNGLQGKRNTFYTGATYESHDSAMIWQFTETIIPKIIA